MKKIIFSCFILFCFSGFGQESSQPIRLAFADEDFGNWHFCGDKDNHKPKCELGDTVKGFNPEIAAEIFRRLQKSYEVVFAEWADDSFFEGLVENKYDVIISNVAKKKSREQYGIFSQLPYELQAPVSKYTKSTGLPVTGDHVDNRL